MDLHNHTIILSKTGMFKACKQFLLTDKQNWGEKSVTHLNKHTLIAINAHLKKTYSERLQEFTGILTVQLQNKNTSQNLLLSDIPQITNTPVPSIHILIWRSSTRRRKRTEIKFKFKKHPFPYLNQNKEN